MFDPISIYVEHIQKLTTIRWHEKCYKMPDILPDNSIMSTVIKVYWDQKQLSSL